MSRPDSFVSFSLRRIEFDTTPPGNWVDLQLWCAANLAAGRGSAGMAVIHRGYGRLLRGSMAGLKSCAVEPCSLFQLTGQIPLSGAYPLAGGWVAWGLNT
jgi:hypothetical protein